MDEIRAAVGHDPHDHTMEQVRELIVGDAVRHLEARVAMLDARLSEVEIGILRQLDALEARIDVLACAVEGDRRTTFEALAKTILDLGEHVRAISRR
ncbi:MAG: hypothetical protein ACKVP4_06760 [Hyphomicrobium sp.]